MKPFDFQLTATDFALSRKSSYLALDPGLGKTIVAALILKRLPDFGGVFVCPPFLVANTEAEFLKWGVEKRRFLILSYTRLSEPETIYRLNHFSLDFENLILFSDEAHFLKNEQAQRTKAFFDLSLNGFSKFVFLSGTPMPNSRPIELWPILKRFAPLVFGKEFFPFARRFCGARKGPFGWKFEGFTNQKEFKARIFKDFMFRVKKTAIKLPEKREALLTVGDSMPPTLSKIEKKILDHFTKEDLIKGEIEKSLGKGQLHLAEYLKHLGEYKLKYVFPFIEHLIYNTDENLIIFAYHKGVIEKLALLLTNLKPLVITGSTPSSRRQEMVDEFQNNPKRRLVIGNIQACGVGFTLTKATRALFVEFSWRDGDNVQASDRIHRIGQNKSVLVQYVVLKDSFDAKRMEILLTKRANSI